MCWIDDGLFVGYMHDVYIHICVYGSLSSSSSSLIIYINIYVYIIYNSNQSEIGDFGIEFSVVLVSLVCLFVCIHISVHC